MTTPRSELTLPGEECLIRAEGDIINFLKELSETSPHQALNDILLAFGEDARLYHSPGYRTELAYLGISCIAKLINTRLPNKIIEKYYENLNYFLPYLLIFKNFPTQHFQDADSGILKAQRLLELLNALLANGYDPDLVIIRTNLARLVASGLDTDNLAGIDDIENALPKTTTSISFDNDKLVMGEVNPSRVVGAFISYWNRVNLDSPAIAEEASRVVAVYIYRMWHIYPEEAYKACRLVLELGNQYVEILLKELLRLIGKKIGAKIPERVQSLLRKSLLGKSDTLSRIIEKLEANSLYYPSAEPKTAFNLKADTTRYIATYRSIDKTVE